MNGIDATKQIRSFNSLIPIIAQTAFNSKVDKENAYNAGCNEFVTKPLSQDTLNAIIHKYLDSN